jgi:predicted CoA-binding protein
MIVEGDEFRTREHCLGVLAVMDKTEAFLSATTFAVAGASTNREKYGSKVFRALVDSGREVYPLNPTAGEIEGQRAYAKLADLPVAAQSLSIVTPPAVTRQIVQQAIESGIQHVWMQPGAEDESASQSARNAGLTVIDDGSCLLVFLAREKK